MGAAMVIYDGKFETITHKDVYSRTIGELIDEDPAVFYLDADLMNSSGTAKLAKERLAQAVNCGVQEANMVGVAAGLSSVGKKPYIHSFGTFASRRCFDQAFLSVGYAKNSVRIFGSDAGVTAAYNGGTHMPFEDMALMRAVPGSTVIDISDGVMLAAALRLVKDRPGLTYMRSTRKVYKALYGEGSEFTIGEGITLRDGKDVTVFACGLLVGEALAAADALAREGVSARVVDLFTVKPLDEGLVARCAAETGAVVSAENHNVIGGLGSAVADALARMCPVPMEFVGVGDRFGEVGPQEYLMERFGLTAADVAAKAKKAIERKKSFKGGAQHDRDGGQYSTGRCEGSGTGRRAGGEAGVGGDGRDAARPKGHRAHADRGRPC